MAKHHLSNAAKAAAMIRKELKKNKIAARVRSKTYSMGSSVNIDLIDEMPATVKQIQQYCNQFERGHFDGMQDMYIDSNRREDVPQVKYVFVSNQISEELKESIFNYLRKRYDCLSSFDNYAQSKNEWLADLHTSVQEIVYRTANGSFDNSFWSQRKPRIRVC